MAQPWTSPAAPGEGDQPVKAFDRQALEATLADALRDAESATPEPDRTDPDPDPVPSPVSPLLRRPPMGGPGPSVVPGPSNRPAPAGASTDPAAAGPRPAPRPTLLGSGLTGPGGPLGGGTLGSSPLAPPSGGLAPLRRPDGAAPTPLAAPRPLATPGLATPGLAVSGLAVSGLAPARPGLAPTGGTTPAEQPTIAIRMPKRSNPPAPAAAAPVPAAPAPAAPVAPPRPAAPIIAWSPSDDDILPGRAAKRRGRLRRG